ncbi:MAG TPA: hypothetical protein VMF55_06345 [Solirubrobacterales bacterium]|nr:hypothetical protein [Solirubrobacterales bacterium]
MTKPSSPQTTTQTPRRRRRRSPWLAAAAIGLVLAALAIPAAASADSILYMKGGDIWLASPDGSKQFQVTSGGGYNYASQSESGAVIVAARENHLFVLDRNGDLVRELPTVIGSSLWWGPYEPQVSPDGTHVAYQYFYTGGGETRTGVAYANTDGSYGDYDLHTGWAYPAWYDDSLLMHSDPPNGLSQDVILRPFGSANNTGRQWFSHGEMPLLHDGDIHANAMAFVAGQNNEFLPVYRYDGSPGSDQIEICYAYKGPNGKFESPSFSPDRSYLSWNEDDGIHVSPSGIDSGCHPERVAEALTIPGGRYPDWGAADVPGPRPTTGGGTTTPPGTTGKPTGKGTDGKGGPAGGRGEVRLRVGGAKLGAALKRGLVVTVSGASGTVALTATVAAPVARKAGLGGKATKVAAGKATAGGATTSVRLRFTAKAARKLARLGSVKLRISGAGTATAATLKR